MTSEWTVAPSRDRLERNGRDTFLLADTLWAAFTTPTLEEWRECVALRNRQGFTGTLISVLPIAHDSSEAAREPFARDAHGAVQLGHLTSEYVDNARAILQAVRECGLTPVLVLLWLNYVPETWGSGLTPELAMDEQQTLHYVQTVVAAFAEFDPIYVLSGDEKFDSPVAIERYAMVGREVRRLAPQALITLHPHPEGMLPTSIAESDDIDFYAFQSGHSGPWDTLPADLAHQYGELRSRPIMNLEPCYEGHGRDKGTARHRARDVRRASWTGILAGAGAGLAYGAHGAWSWHRRGKGFLGEGFSGTPYPASIALTFPGAWDVGLIRHIVETHALWSLRDDADLLVGDASGARAARGGDRIVIYSPEPFGLTVAIDWGAYSITCYNLETRLRENVRSRPIEAGGHRVVRIEQPDFLADSLYVFERV
jgi:Protein of unknown function (DUF4038)